MFPALINRDLCLILAVTYSKIVSWENYELGKIYIALSALHFVLFFGACTLKCRILNWSLVNCLTCPWIWHSYIRIDCRIIYARGGWCVLSIEMLFYWGHFYLKKLSLELEDWFSLDKQKEMFTYWFTL